MATKTAKKGRKLVWMGVAAALLGGGAAGLHFYRKREPVITVQTEKAARRNITETVVATGKIQPVVQVVINPEVSGEIIALPVKEGQLVKKGDLLVKIKPDNYVAQRNSAEASYRSALAGRDLAKANLEKAQLEFNRIKELFDNKLVSDSQYLEGKTALDVMSASHKTSTHQVDQAKAFLDRAEDDLAKTTIVAPTDGTVTKLKSQLGERVVGTAMMAGTEIMTVADLNEMEAKVDVGEIDVILIELGQKAVLEVDSFRDKKFGGVVTEIANAAKTSAAGTQQEATKFEVKIRVTEKELFRPGMSVTAEVETRYRTNVVTVPIQSVTVRLPPGAKDSGKKEGKPESKEETGATLIEPSRKKEGAVKPIEVVFGVVEDKARMQPVKRGINNDEYVEITSGVKEGEEIVSGGFKAINREIEDGKKLKRGDPNGKKEAKTP